MTLKPKSNNFRYFILRALSGLFFIYTIQSIFILSKGFSIEQLALYASLIIIFSILLEIPTGFVADKFSRKLSTSLGFFFQGLTYILLIFTTTFPMLIFVSFIFSLGLSLKSGAFDSLIYDDLKSQNQEDNYLKLTTKGSTIDSIVMVFASFIGPILYTINTSLPFILTALTFFVLAGLVMTFHETKSSQEKIRNIKIFDGVLEIIRNKPLLFIVLIDLVIAIYSNTYYGVLFFPKINQLGMPIKYLGVLDGANLGLMTLMLLILPKIIFKKDKMNLVFYTVASSLVFILFVFSHNLVLAIITGVLFDLTWNARNHIMPTITNKYFSSQNRATSISSMNFISGCGTALLIPLAVNLFNKSAFYSLIPLGIILVLFMFYPKEKKID